MNILDKLKYFLGFTDYRLPERSLDELKIITRTLFIDDKSFKVIQILKNAGWVNTRWLKDVESLDSDDIASAHIIFVDINEVGKKLNFKDEGLGLVIALRQKYPYKKIVVYSAERTGDRFHPGFSAADGRLPKNAEPFEFQTIVEEYSRDSFSLNECVARLQIVLRTEFGIRLTEDQIIKKMKYVAKKGDFSVEMIGSVFSLKNASAVASIVQLFVDAN